MIKNLIIFSLVLLSLKGLAQKDSSLFEKYMKRGDLIHEKLRRGDTDVKFDSAINAYNTAMLIFPKYADSARNRILDVFTTIDSLKDDAIKQRIRADKATDTARRAKKDAEDQRRKADSASKKFNAYNLANAPYKYIRLIRDGPKEESKIKKDSFDLKLIAYCDHLDTLQKLITDSVKTILDTIQPGARKDYADLREKLYYNNDLYEKIYYCFKAQDSIEKILVTKENKDPGHFIERFFSDNSSGFKLDNGKITWQKPGSSANGTALDAGQVFTSFTLSDNPKRIFCATDDNYITVYNIDDSLNTGKTLEKIPMGTKVTALDFDDNNNIIYFGTIRGDIGFIKYKDDWKNQPVYDIENALGSKITAMDIFEYEKDTFLLATGQSSKAVVYKIDSNFLAPNNKFSGNILPEQDMGNINHAMFDNVSHRVILETKLKIYSWDPFTESVLKIYKGFMKLPPEILSETKFY